jgi:hypothetical protein
MNGVIYSFPNGFDVHQARAVSFAVHALIHAACNRSVIEK